MFRTLWLGLLLAAYLGTMSGCKQKEEEPAKFKDKQMDRFKGKDANPMKPPDTPP